MRPYSLDQLSVLAEAYCAATGIALSSLSDRVTDKRNHKLFKRIREGLDCTAGNAEQASAWFAANWPEGSPWPSAIPLPDAEAADSEAAV